jgi:hypothetical protein
VEALEALSTERRGEQVERLAHHALRGVVWDKALCYYRQAGTIAEARSAYREAVVCFEQALCAVQHLPENRDTIEQATDLQFDLRNALLVIGDHKPIVEYLRRDPRPGTGRSTAAGLGPLLYDSPFGACRGL